MSENLVFGRKFAKKSWFGRSLQQISVLDEISENLDFGRNFRKSKNLDFGRNFLEILNLVKILKV